MINKKLIVRALKMKNIIHIVIMINRPSKKSLGYNRKLLRSSDYMMKKCNVNSNKKNSLDCNNNRSRLIKQKEMKRKE